MKRYVVRFVDCYGNYLPPCYVSAENRSKAKYEAFRKAQELCIFETFKEFLSCLENVRGD